MCAADPSLIFVRPSSPLNLAMMTLLPLAMMLNDEASKLRNHISKFLLLVLRPTAAIKVRIMRGVVRVGK